MRISTSLASGGATRPRTRAAVVLLAVVVVVLAACSTSKKTSSNSGSSSPGATSTTRTTRGVTATSIKVGGMVYGTFFSGADVGAKARFERANKEGGVFGRKIDFVGASETNAEQAKAAAIAQKLVEQEQVFALVPVVSTELRFSGLVNERKVPLFGFGVDPLFCGNPYAFSYLGCVSDPAFKITSDAGGVVMKAHFHGDSNKTVALIGEDFDAGKAGVKLAATSLPPLGFHVVYSKNPLPAPPAPVGDYSPFVAELMKSASGHPPDVIYQLTTGADSIGLYQALRAAGYKGFVQLVIYDPRVAKPLDGAAIILQTAAYEAAPQIPQLQQMINDVKAVAPDQLLTSGVAHGYWSADMFLALLQKTGKDLTVERMLAASQGWSYGVPQIIGTSRWPAYHSLPVPCESMVVAKNGTFVPDVPLTCGRIIRVK